MTYVAYNYGFAKHIVKSLIERKERLQQQRWRFAQKHNDIRVASITQQINAVDEELRQYRADATTRHR